jgi:hypothetical protein
MTPFLTPHDPDSYLTKESSKQSFWSSLKRFESKIWLFECKQKFLRIWPCDLLLDWTWPRFKLDRDIIKIVILTKFHQDRPKSVASIECKQDFSNIWPSDLVFDPTWPRFELDWDNIKTNYSVQLSKNSVNIVTFRV